MASLMSVEALKASEQDVKMWKEGKTRDETKMKYFENKLTEAAMAT